MNALPQPNDDATTSTPISEAIARPVQLAPQTPPEIFDLNEPAWYGPVVEQLEHILALHDNWDHFNAGPIRRDVILFIINMLGKIMRPDTPAPHISPMPHEGLMLEWHQNGVDLEIEIEKPGNLWVSFEDSVEGIDEEEPLASDFTKLALPIDKLTKRALLGG